MFLAAARDDFRPPASRIAAAPAIACLECGTTVNNPRAAEFCCTRCRQAWNNRRAMRGAELYDLAMTWRCERASGQERHVMTLISRQIRIWRDEDRAVRAGRRSWRKLADALAAKAYLFARVFHTRKGTRA